MIPLKASMTVIVGKDDCQDVTAHKATEYFLGGAWKKWCGLGVTDRTLWEKQKQKKLWP